MVDPKRAGEQADALIAEQNRLRAEAVASAATPAPVAEDQPPADAIPAEGKTKTQPDVSVPADRQASNAEVEALRAQVQVADQRWSVLQGMVKKKDSEIEQLRTLLAQLNLKKDDAKPEQTPAGAAVTGQDVEDFGQDLIDLITKIANNVAQANAAGFSRKLEEVMQSVNGVTETTAKTARETFDERLTTRVPRWEAINQDPAFMVWLDVMDDFTGAKRIDLLNDAYTRMELDRTAKFFEKFIAENTVATPPKQDIPPAPAPVASPVKLVEPGKGRAAPPAAPAQNSNTWTAESIKQLYADQRTGKLSADEFNRLERDLFMAQRENRVAA